MLLLSRRMIAPLAPGSTAWSNSLRMAALYGPVKWRRVGRSRKDEGPVAEVLR
jgi:hypothetical protein